jgi:hypothetical protein
MIYGKLVLAGERQLDDRSWVRAEVVPSAPRSVRLLAVG